MPGTVKLLYDIINHLNKVQDRNLAHFEPNDGDFLDLKKHFVVKI